MIACIPVTHDGLTARGWGRAPRIAVASVAEGNIVDWQEFDVGWDTLFHEETEGAHHARVARFVIDHRVQFVVAEHMGPGMNRMLTTMGIHLSLGAHGDARAAVLAALQHAA